MAARVFLLPASIDISGIDSCQQHLSSKYDRVCILCWYNASFCPFLSKSRTLRVPLTSQKSENETERKKLYCPKSKMVKSRNSIVKEKSHTFTYFHHHRARKYVSFIIIRKLETDRPTKQRFEKLQVAYKERERLTFSISKLSEVSSTLVHQ